MIERLAWLRRPAARELGVAGVLLLLVTLPLAPVVYLGRAPLPDYLLWFAPWATGAAPSTPWNALWYDAVGQYWPWRTLLAAGLRANELPLWNPYQLGGYAFCGNGQSALFYPLNWVLFGWLSVVDAFRANAVLHLWLAAYGVHRVVGELGGRRLAGLAAGAVFALSAFLVGWTMLPTLVASAAWLPWVAAGLERCRRTDRLGPAAWAGGALGLSALAGHPQVFYYVAVTAGLLAVARTGRRRWLAGAVCMGLGGLLAAPMVLPLLELAPRSHRPPGAESSYATFLDRAVPADRLVTLALPDFYGSPARGTIDPFGDSRRLAETVVAGGYFGLDRRGAVAPGDYTEFGLFAGLTALLLLGLAGLRGGAGRFYAGLALVALLLALGTWLNWPLYRFLPGYASAAGPCRLNLVWCFGAAVAAGLGLDSACREPVRPKLAAALAGLPALLLVAGWMLASLLRRDPLGPLLELTSYRHLIAATVALAGCALAGWLLHTAPPWVVPLAVAELVRFGWGFNPSCPRELLQPEPPLVARLRADVDALGSRLAVLDRPEAWGFYRPPAGLLLPPNLATAARLREVGGYDSLLPAEVKDRLARLTDGQPTPLVNGNMLLLGRGPTTWPGAVVLRRAEGSGEPGWQLGFGPPGRVGPSGERTGAVPLLDRCNRVAIDIGGGHELIHDSAYPGWRAWLVSPRGGVRELPWAAGRGQRLVAEPLLPPGQVRWVFAPLTVRLGGFAFLVGLALLAAIRPTGQR